MKLRVAMLFLALGIASAAAQRPQQSPDDIIKRAKESFKTAKNAEEIKSVAMWCHDMLKASTFREHERLMMQALKLMEAQKQSEALPYLERARKLDEGTEMMADSACRPD